MDGGIKRSGSVEVNHAHIDCCEAPSHTTLVCHQDLAIARYPEEDANLYTHFPTMPKGEHVVDWFTCAVQKSILAHGTVPVLGVTVIAGTTRAHPHIDHQTSIISHIPIVLAALRCASTGWLYVTSHYLCFYCNVLVYQTREVIPISDIREIKRRRQMRINNGFQVYYKDSAGAEQSISFFSFTDANKAAPPCVLHTRHEAW